MPANLHVLKGCSPAPLANYLKALGILRLVSEQADPLARGWWQGEHFCLLSTFTTRELEKFFLDAYTPTPMLAAWNAGSGFYRTWDAKKNKLRNNKNLDALELLLTSSSLRVALLQAAVNEIRQILPKYCHRVDVTTLDKKQLGRLLIIPDGEGPMFPVIPKDDSGKAMVQQALLRFSRSSPFYRSSLVDAGEKIRYPWMWGSGGNDGGIDYTGRFFENLCIVLMPKNTVVNTALLQNALFGDNTIGFASKSAGKVGQFSPFAAGGANVTTGTGSQHHTHLNPWDYILLIEGAILFSSRATRALTPDALARAAAPFAVQSHAAGFASTGTEDAQRGEQWLPLWSQPTTLLELSTMLGEARVQLSRHPAHRPIDMARAIGRLGSDRGIRAFMRYGYLRRNGKSTMAVPLGRLAVRANPHSLLIDDLAKWMEAVRRWTLETKAPTRLLHAERRMADAVFSALTHQPTPDRWQAVLLAAAEVESLQAAGTGFEAGPIPSLTPEWIVATADNTAEFRLALTLGGAASRYSHEGFPIDSVRHHFLPLEPTAKRFRISDKRLVNDSRVVASCRDSLRDLIAIVERRLVESAQTGQRRSRLVAANGCGARLDDLADFIRGNLDLPRLLGLARAFMAIRWDRWSPADLPQTAPRADTPDECWLSLRLCCLAWPLSKGYDIPAEERCPRLLRSGESARAIAIARQRLLSAGIRPPMYVGTADSDTARRWAAALVFPIHRGTARRVAALVDPSMKGLIHA